MFTEAEIERAVRFFPKKKKVSGSDGLPNEFAQLFWMDIKEDVISLVHGKIALHSYSFLSWAAIQETHREIKISFSCAF